MNRNRNIAMWLGIAAVVTGAVGMIFAATGDLRIGTIVIGQSREIGFGVWVVALGLVVLGLGAVVTPSRPLAGAGLMFVGVLAALVGSWNEIAQWSVDLWTTATGGIVAYVDEQGLAHMPGFWDVLVGSFSMLGYAGTAILGTAGAIVAAFAPAPEAAELRHAMRPAAL